MKKSSRMSIVHPHTAGVDIGAEFHVVAVPPDADTEPVRTFQSFTGDLQRMSDWLKTCHITTIAMESTGVYWLPAFEILEAAGFKVILVNARDAKKCSRSGDTHADNMLAGITETDEHWPERIEQALTLRTEAIFTSRLRRPAT